MQRMILCLIVFVLSSGLTAQNRPNLDDRIDAFLIPNPLPPCAIEAVVTRLMQTARIPLGIERSPGCPMTRPLPIINVPSGDEDLSGLTVRAALDHLMTLDPTYRWEERDGVPVVRPVVAWTDAVDALNSSTDAFRLTEAPVALALRSALRLPNTPAPNTANPNRLIGRPFSVAFPGGTLLDALNAIIRAHQSVSWHAGTMPSRSGDNVNDPVLEISMMAFDLSGVSMGTPFARLRARP